MHLQLLVEIKPLSDKITSLLQSKKAFENLKSEFSNCCIDNSWRWSFRSGVQVLECGNCFHLKRKVGNRAGAQKAEVSWKSNQFLMVPCHVA